MTTVLERPAQLTAVVAPPAAPPLNGGRLRALLAVWLVVLIAGMGLVVYGFGSYFQTRDQRSLMREARGALNRAANESTGLGGVTVAKRAPEFGAPLGILEIGAVRMQQVVVEGTQSAQTRRAPGHAPGTAGLGQPGNSVVVGRRKAYGAPFSRIAGLHKGNRILVSTTQGQTVYAVTSVRKVEMTPRVIEQVYGPSKDDRLTLVTSASLNPRNQKSAIVVVGQSKSTPFAPTPQGARHQREFGGRGDRGALPAVIIALVLYGLAMSASIVLYRRLQPRTAYLLTIAPVVALTVIAAETFSRVFPAWM
ncbi:MAG TPA: class E sortase [Acidimicrobiales bacterium]|nr:class E sortase [Acidimicrobiales bacterium]